MQILRDLRL